MEDMLAYADVDIAQGKKAEALTWLNAGLAEKEISGRQKAEFYKRAMAIQGEVKQSPSRLHCTLLRSPIQTHPCHAMACGAPKRSRTAKRSMTGCFMSGGRAGSGTPKWRAAMVPNRALPSGFRCAWSRMIRR